MSVTSHHGTATKDHAGDTSQARTPDAASPQAQALHHVADHIEDFAGQLRTTDLAKVADQATDIARRNPLLFVGGAVIAGFAAARFLKARDPKPAIAAHSADPWARPPQGRSDDKVRSNNNGDWENG